MNPTETDLALSRTEDLPVLIVHHQGINHIVLLPKIIQNQLTVDTTEAQDQILQTGLIALLPEITGAIPTHLKTDQTAHEEVTHHPGIHQVQTNPTAGQAPEVLDQAIQVLQTDHHHQEEDNFLNIQNNEILFFRTNH